MFNDIWPFFQFGPVQKTVSSPGPCASSGGRLPEALFMVFLLEVQKLESKLRSGAQKCAHLVDLENAASQQWDEH